MKYSLRNLFIAATLLCLEFSFAPSGYAQALQPANQMPGNQAYPAHSLAILFTGDMHSCVDKYPQLATFIKQEREFYEKKGVAVVVVDAGDIAMGSVFSTVTNTEASEYRGLGLMGYDAYVFGNHDFDIGLKALGYMYYNANIHGRNLNPITKQPINFPMNVTANLDKTNEVVFENARSYIGQKPYVILNKNGVKIGIFGLLGERAFNVSNEKENMTLLDPVKTAKTVVQILKSQGVNYIICLSHSGSMLRDKSEDGILAKACPDIDVIISGHDHEAIFKPWSVGNVVIGAAGSGGSLLGELGISGGKSSGKGNSHNLLFYELKSVPSDIASDPAAKILLDSVELKVIGKFNRQFGISPSGVVSKQMQPLAGQPDAKGNFPLGYAVARSYYYAAVRAGQGKDLDTNRMFSVVPAGVIRKGLAAGDIKYSDAFDILPLGLDAEGKLGYPLVECWVSGKELKELCEVNASIAGKMPDAYMTFYGLKYTYNSAALPFLRVKKVYVHGRETDDKTLYHVITGYYTAMCINIINENSHGLLKIYPKTQLGNRIASIDDMLVLGPSERSKLPVSVNEWYAFAEYLRLRGSQPNAAVTAGTDERSMGVWVKYVGCTAAGIAVIILIIIGIIKVVKKSSKKVKEEN
ncbi:MAG: 5'-nucleotidase C-terminal domain-containing protein [Bacteroidales bacterium]|jgi:5'-nucleotidase/UDP-sugar diphosphatase|nr:5'-nucleotidase C-terminal domain-containing protein [Bacteroidales bacterium]MCI1733316.1 5'-nucleotidase C-terminal domain-containing protein [Bacteroidales bacterium]